MKFNIIVFSLALIIGLKSYSQSKIWIYGHVYENGKNDKQGLIPFATISYYSYENQSELNYSTMSGPTGNYLIKPYNYKAKYHAVVEAPGYKTIFFNLKEIPEVWNGNPFSGNASVNICMVRDSTKMEEFISPREYTIKQLKKQYKIKTFKDLIEQISDVKIDGMDLLTQQGGSVRIFVNGAGVTSEICKEIYELPVSIISKLEYYNLPKGGLYEGALDIILNVGNVEKAPSYILKGSEFAF